MWWLMKSKANTFLLLTFHFRKFIFRFFSFWQFSRSNTCCSDCCCSIDVWGIVLNILLQDAPFLTFRLLIIIHYQIISYMNVFFTCNLLWHSPTQLNIWLNFSRRQKHVGHSIAIVSSVCGSVREQKVEGKEEEVEIPSRQTKER